MDESAPYNPLDKDHLADSIAREFHKQDLHPLPPGSFTGAGIYAIYYCGNFPLYSAFSQSLKDYEAANKENPKTAGLRPPKPLYIGKSEPPGSRKGARVGDDESDEEPEEAAEIGAQDLLIKKPTHKKLYRRLVKHSKSIAATTNLSLSDFRCRYMLVDEVWVPLGEARLVDSFRPVWNVLIEGFGSNVEGGGRKDTARPVWDILHPGRKEDLGFQISPDVEKQIIKNLREARDLKALAAAIAVHREAKTKFNKARKAAQAKLK